MRGSYLHLISNTALHITFLSYYIPFTGKHEPNKKVKIWSVYFFSKLPPNYFLLHNAIIAYIQKPRRKRKLLQMQQIGYQMKASECPARILQNLSSFPDLLRGQHGGLTICGRNVIKFTSVTIYQVIMYSIGYLS